MVTGGAGVLGPLICAEFASRGYRVRAVVRRTIDASIFPAATEVVICDITDGAALMRALQGAATGVVCHLAALLHSVNPRADAAGEYTQVNVDGTRRLMEAARRAGVARVVLASTIAVYGDNPGRASEATPPQPSSLYAESKLAAESVALTYREQNGGALCTVLRLAAVYGGRMKGNYVRLLHACQNGIVPIVGSGANRRTLVHERDVAKAFVLAAEEYGAAGRVYNVTDGSFHTMREIIGAIARARGHKAYVLPVLLGLAFGVAGVVEYAGTLSHVAPRVTRNAITKLTDDVAVDGSLIMSTLGFRPEVDLEEGWREAVSLLEGPGSDAE